jgi:hypothetical protein
MHDFAVLFGRAFAGVRENAVMPPNRSGNILRTSTNFSGANA